MAPMSPFAATVARAFPALRVALVPHPAERVSAGALGAARQCRRGGRPGRCSNSVSLSSAANGCTAWRPDYRAVSLMVNDMSAFPCRTTCDLQLDERSLYLRRLVVRALDGGGRGHIGSSHVADRDPARALRRYAALSRRTSRTGPSATAAFSARVMAASRSTHCWRTRAFSRSRCSTRSAAATRSSAAIPRPARCPASRPRPARSAMACRSASASRWGCACAASTRASSS